MFGKLRIQKTSYLKLVLYLVCSHVDLVETSIMVRKLLIYQLTIGKPDRKP